MCKPKIRFIFHSLLFIYLFATLKHKYLQKKQKNSKFFIDETKPFEFLSIRYETKCFQRNLSPNVQMELPTENLSQLSLNSGITKSVSTMASSTSIKRVTGSQKVTTSFNSIERKN